MSRRTAGRPAAVTVVAGLLVAALTGCGSGRTGSAAGAPGPSATSGSGRSGSASAGPTPLPPLPASPRPLPSATTPAPTHVDVPSIGVSSDLEPLALLPGGQLAPPSTFPEAGWYAGGVRPGDDGPAIIAGHVDSTRGPAVFFRLDQLHPGDPVTVTRADGSTVRFVVESSARYAKSQFPTADVYGPTPTPELRLITCTGDFDRAAHSYLDNLVVTAVPAT